MVASSGDGRSPAELGAIPEDLKSFLLRAPNSLLIKGGGGTGKTSLALTILRILDSRDGFLYLSTRASPSQLFLFHPWLKAWVRPKRGKGKTPSQGGIPESFVDCRLDEPTQLFERITNQLMDATSPTVVIDTWDSLKDFREEDSLQSNLRVLMAWCERAHARLILVDEDPENSVFDAIVDGVVLLEQRFVDGRMIREMTLSKLHGVNIESPKNLFTLRDARFRSFRPLHVEDLVFGPVSAAPKVATPPLSVPTGDYISTGYGVLDSELGGGLPTGSLVNIALSRGVDARVALILLQNSLGGFVNSGRGVILVPFKGLAPGFFESYLRSEVPTSRRRQISHEWDGHSSEKRRPSRRASKEAGGAPSESPKNSAGDIASLIILGAETLENASGSAPSAGLERLASFVLSNRGIGFVVTRDVKSAFTEHLSNSAMRLEVASEGGTLLIQPQPPSSKLFAIEVGRKSERPTISIEPIV